MDENYKDLEIKLESAYYNRNKVGTRVDKVDLVDAAKVIEEDVLSKVGTDTSTDKIVITQTISELQSLAIDKKVAYCNESAMLYRYNSDISDYLENDNTVVTSSISGGWIEYDSYSKLFKSSSTIILDHLNQSSTVMLSADTDFIAKVDTIVNNGHTHICKLFCNGFTPTFSGFTFLTDSSPLDVLTLDTTIGYYYTIIFFKIAGDNKYIILEKVLSTDVTPPTITVSVALKTDATISYTINSNENSELKWALYAGGSTDKTISDIDAGTGALQHGAKSLASGDNTLTINSLTELTTYDLWQYAFDSIPNNSTPAKTTVQTNETGVSQLVAPILGTVTVLSTTSLSVPIASSSIDADASSVSLHYKRVTDPTYTIISNIGKTDVSHTLSALNVNTQYYIYLVAVGDGISYSDSTASNIATSTTQNVVPTLSVPYTSTDGLIIELPFSRAMANPSTQAGLFTLSGSRSVVSAALKSGDATKIQVTVDNAYTDSDIITISITSGLVPADNGVVFAGVTNQSVTNNVQAPLTYPTGYVALHSADQSIVDLSAKTVSDLSDNNRGLSLFSETTPASDGGVLANGNKSILFPAGTAFKFPSFVCNNVNGFAFACVFTFEDTNSSCGFANSPHNWCGKLGASVQMSSGSKFSTIAAPSSNPIVAFVVGLENNSGVIKVKQYAYNLTTNNIITNDVGTAVTFSSITKDFGIGEINYNGAVNYAGATKWQHSIFYERSLNDTEFSALCAKIVNDYKV